MYDHIVSNTLHETNAAITPKQKLFIQVLLKKRCNLIKEKHYNFLQKRLLPKVSSS